MKLKCYEVVWADSCTRDGWDCVESYLDMVPAEVTSIGWLLSKTRQSVTLVQNFSPNGLVSSSITIPRGCIKEMRRWRGEV